MKKSINLLLALALLLITNALSAQTLDKVLEKHFETIGQEKLVSMKAYSIKAKIVQMGMELPMQMQMERPNKFRIEMEMQGQKIIQAFDGKDGWFIAPFMSPDPQDLTGDQLKQALEQADFDGELYDWEKKGSTVELVGKEDMEGTEVFNLKVKTKDGDIKNYYIDAETYLILKIKSQVNAQGQMVDLESIMSDYQDINGVIMAMKIESKSPMGTQNVILEEVKVAEDLDDSIFARPAKK